MLTGTALWSATDWKVGGKVGERERRYKVSFAVPFSLNNEVSKLPELAKVGNTCMEFAI